jgi:hypothetical protein
MTRLLRKRSQCFGRVQNSHTLVVLEIGQIRIARDNYDVSRAQSGLLILDAYATIQA